MKIIESSQEMSQWSLGQTKHSKITLVPTMGALHKAHLSLINLATQSGDLTIVSIFVNPLQFGPGEDFSQYPRTLEADLKLCEQGAVDVVFTPQKSLYGNHAPISVNPGPVAEKYCGARRPGHFSGVLTIVLKLFSLCKPHQAVFGQKDAQQLWLISQMVKAFDLDIKILSHPIVREKDGLAMSSRNKYLSQIERSQALGLVHGLKQIVKSFKAGLKKSDELFKIMKSETDKAGVELEFCACVSQQDFNSVIKTKPGNLVLAAAKLGKTRLIDNIMLPHDDV